MKNLEKALYALFFWAMLLAGCWVLFGLDLFLLALMAGFVPLCLLARRIPASWFAPLLFLLAFLLRVGIVLVIDPPPIQDFARVLDASRLFSRGDFSFQQTRYFQGWAGQTGQVIFQGLLLKLWDNVLVIKLANCLASAGITALVYLTARRLFAEDAARAGGLFYCFCPLSLSLAPVLTNQHSAALFVCLGVYWLVVAPGKGTGQPAPGHWWSKSLLRFPLAGLCIALANALRPDALVFVVAVAAFCLFGAVQQPLPRQLRHYALALLLFAGTYFLAYRLMCWGVVAAGINANGLSTQNFWLKFVHGFNQQSRGKFSTTVYNAVEELADQGASAAAIAQAEKEMLWEELRAGLGSIVRLFADKEAILWKQSAVYWGFGHLQERYPSLYSLAQKADQLFAVVSFALAMLGFVYSRRKGHASLESLLPAFIIFATFAVYLFIEVQPRYVYGSQPAVYILAAGGLEMLVHCGKVLRAKAKEESRTTSV